MWKFCSSNVTFDALVLWFVGLLVFSYVHKVGLSHLICRVERLRKQRVLGFRYIWAAPAVCTFCIHKLFSAWNPDGFRLQDVQRLA